MKMEQEDDKYIYPYINHEFKNKQSYITIICKKCKRIFKQSYRHHFIRKQGCSHCNNKVKSLEELIIKLNEIHKNKYEYINIKNEYKNTESTITIKCKDCDYVFKMDIKHHLYHKQGCKKCKKVYSYNLNELINKLNEIHKNKYEYINIENEYKNTNSVLTIKCKKCNNIFPQKVENHIQQQGCPFCAGKQKLTTDQILLRIYKIHHNKYEYPYILNEYENTSSNITILCKKHQHYFNQNMDNHLNKKQGCPLCRESKGEKNIVDYLLQKNIIYQRQKKFKECKNKRCLSFDFYLPTYNMCIEFNGIQHYKQLEYFGGIKSYLGMVHNDNIKKKFCKKYKIKLLIIKYNENIDEILNKYLCIKLK